MDPKAIKKLVKETIVPYITGLRNEIEDGNKTLKEIFEAQKKNLELSYDLEINSNDFRGPAGKTPVADKDYPSIGSIHQYIQKIIPKKGKDFFNEKDINEIIVAVAKLIPPGKKGKDAKVDYEVVKKLAKPLIDEHVKEIKKQIKNVEKEIYKEIKETPKLRIRAEEIVRLLESLKGSARLDAKAIKGLEKFVQTLIIAGGGTASGGGATGSAVATFLELTDTPDSYVGQGGKGFRVKATEDGIEFYTIAGDTDEKSSVQSDDTAGYLKDKVLAGTGLSATVGGSAGARTYTLESLITQYTDEMAQDAVGGALNASLVYVDATPSIGINLDNGNLWNALQSFDTLLGAEKITNGGFPSSSGWTTTTGWAITGGVATHNANGTGTLSQSSGSMVTPLVAGESYEFVFQVLNYVSGTVTPSIGGVTLTARSANGTYTERVTVSSTASLAFTPSNTARFDIDVVSLKKISGGGVLATNSRSATSSYPSPISAPVAWHSTAWKSNATAASQNVDFQSLARGLTGASVVTGEWAMQVSINGAAFADILKVSSTGRQTTLIISGVGETIGYEISAPFSNSSPGTTRHLKLTSSVGGGYNWIDFVHVSTLREAIGGGSGGGLDFYASGGNYFGYYSGNSGLTSNTLFSYNYPTAFVHTNYGNFGGGVNAGSQSSPTSTLQSQGSTALKVKRIVANQSLDNTATHWLLDATTASSCTGTPSAACTSWGNQTDCEKWDAHGGCAWNAGSSCSAFDNESGMSTCTGTSGCSASTTACSGGDQTTCEADDDAYGGPDPCAWVDDNPSCSGFDEMTCGSTGGCSQNYVDCSTYNGNQGGCEADPHCTWNDPNCDGGNHFHECTGNYSSFSCHGTKYTGSCTGTYGSGCFGTSTCAGINDSTNCGLETGCTWSTLLSATLPDGETCPDRTYWLCNDASGGADSVILPYSGQTINATSSYTLATYKQCVHIAYYKKTADCSAYDGNESTCGSTSGCTQNYVDCASYASNQSACEADSHCTWSDPDCNGGNHFHSCSGTYTLSKNWYVFGT